MVEIIFATYEFYGEDKSSKEVEFRRFLIRRPSDQEIETERA